MICKVKNCNDTRYCKGYCIKHYQRMRRLGSINLPKRPSVSERFYKFVHKTSTCWLWTGTVNNKGYGRFGYGGGSKTVLAHRMSFYLTNGHWPNRARHTCDTPLCVRPSHIIEGSQRQNMEDAVQRERMKKKLTWKKVRAIRLSDKPAKVLARRYNVTPELINMVRRNVIWKEAMVERDGGKQVRPSVIQSIRSLL